MRLAKKSECEKLHRELWNWLADTGKDKGQWPGWEIYGKRDNHNKCFACEFTFSEGMHRCTKCPLNWGNISEDEYEDNIHNDDLAQCGCLWESLYAKWVDSCYNTDIVAKKHYARLIAEMPWNPK